MSCNPVKTALTPFWLGIFIENSPTCWVHRWGKILSMLVQLPKECQNVGEIPLYILGPDCLGEIVSHMLGWFPCCATICSNISLICWDDFLWYTVTYNRFRVLASKGSILSSKKTWALSCANFRAGPNHRYGGSPRVRNRAKKNFMWVFPKIGLGSPNHPF